MLNQTVLVGRLINDPEVKKLDSGKEVANITLAVPRAYKMRKEFMKLISLTVLFGIMLLKIQQNIAKRRLIRSKGKIQTTMVDDKGNRSGS